MATAIHPKRSNPVGYRFHPTDQELVGHFLNRKILYPDDEKMPIAELKVCDFEPWDLSGNNSYLLQFPPLVSDIVSYL